MKSLSVKYYGFILQTPNYAIAFLQGRDFAIPDDVKFLAPHVLSHRSIAGVGRRSRTIVERLLRSVTVP
jgi:MoxR-like ATPase